MIRLSEIFKETGFTRRGFRYASVILFASLLMSGCSKKTKQNLTESQNYKKAVSDFYIGLAAEQTDNALFAYNKMFEVTKLYPDEPAVWANLGVFAMRQGNYDLAQKRLSTALKLAPKNGKIQYLMGLLKSQQGQIEEAATDMREAVKLSPDNPYIHYALIQELERQNSQGSDKEISRLISDLKKMYPDNLAVTLEEMRFAARQKDVKQLENGLNQFEDQKTKWPEDVRKELDKVNNLIKKQDFQNLTIELAFLENVLQQMPEYQHDMNQIELPPNQIGFLIQHFLTLPEPKASAAQIDSKLAFKKQSATGKLPGKASSIGMFSMRGGRIPLTMAVSGSKIYLSDGRVLDYPGNNSSGYHDVASIDYNYDFQNDLAAAGSRGFRLYQQQADSSFKDVTATLKLPKTVTGRSYDGIWAADVDLDGDLDLILSQTNGPAIELRNNGDNTFTEVPLFAKVDGLVDFQWADLDNDGDADAALLTKTGKLEIYLNDRLGHFKEVPASVLPSDVLGFKIADIDGDGQFDIVLLKKNGDIDRLSYDQDKQQWVSSNLVKWATSISKVNPGEAQVFVQDFDNNGRLDLLASAAGESHLWLSDPDGTLKSMQPDYPVSVGAVADVNGNSRLDWLGLSDQNVPEEWINSGSDNYNGEIIRPRASNTLGDRRINSFGIGGILEARSGLIYQRQLITSPLVHLGVGTYSQADMLRIIWPNGSVQAEFAELSSSTTITNQQSLKGSCPWLFAYNGKKMNFVTDFLWRSPLGLRINAQKSASVSQTEDWVKIGRNQLKPKNGFYDVRITAELWETHFFDYVALMTVDHPDGTHVFVDERFAFPPPKLKVYETGPLHQVKRVLDEQGNDVTAIVAHKDGRYLAHFKNTKYQGIAHKHYIQIDLGSNLPQRGPLWLVAYGWVYPTDSSINFAISQGSIKPPQGISVEIPDGKGGWKVAEANLGFPEGKNKTILINLEGLFKGKGDHQIRLTTSTETYWDAIWWAQGLSNKNLRTQRLLPATATLRYRGYSKMIQKTRSSPEVPDYQEIIGTTPKWQDLVGYYTRYGDVKPLLKKVDDRYVIMNAGDEMRFKFKAPHEPQKGWVRDFVMIGDGWEKDGDYNTTFSRTVIPLPSHSNPDYTTPPTTLQNDPVYKKHKADWIHYQTRYITPKPFYQALVADKQSNR